MQSEEGQKYLENAYNYRQDKADRTGLAEMCGFKGVRKNG